MHHVSLVAGTKGALHHGCARLPAAPAQSILAAAPRIKVNELVPQSPWPLYDQRAGLRTKRIFVKYHLPPTTNPAARAPYRKQLRADGTTSPYRIPRAQASIETLERELGWTARNKPNKSDIRDILGILIRERGVKPSSQHFEALILENGHPQQGSIASLEAVLEDMKDSDVAKGAAIHSAVLKVCLEHHMTSQRLIVLRFSPFTPAHGYERRLLMRWLNHGCREAPKIDTCSQRLSYVKVRSSWRRRRLQRCAKITFTLSGGCTSCSSTCCVREVITTPS